MQKFSIGMETQLGDAMTLSSDYVHTLGLNEPRVQVINPRIEKICNPAYRGSTPASPLCVRGVDSRLFDRSFVDAGLPANRIEQISGGKGERRERRVVVTVNEVMRDSRMTRLVEEAKAFLAKARTERYSLLRRDLRDPNCAPKPISPDASSVTVIGSGIS